MRKRNIKLSSHNLNNDKSTILFNNSLLLTICLMTKCNLVISIMHIGKFIVESNITHKLISWKMLISHSLQEKAEFKIQFFFITIKEGIVIEFH